MRSDVIILGAGPAGSLAAVALARRGVGVTVIEQSAFPRDKVCGECVSAVGLDVLRRAGLTPAFFDAGATTMTRSLVHPRAGPPLDVRLPRAMAGLTRRAFDALLLNAARAAGAAVLQPARCEAVEPGARPAARVRDLVDNRVTTLTARVALVADGKGALPGAAPAATGDLGVKAHFAGVDGPADAVQLFAFDGHYGGVAPVEGRRWNVALSISAERVRAARGDLDAIMARMLRENAAFAQQFAGATREGPWLASPLPRFPVRRGWPENVIPVGNAAAALEPVGGEGMGLALRSAELAADAVADALARGGAIDVAGLRAAYGRLWRHRRLACRATAVALSNGWDAAGVGLARENPFLVRAGMKLMGK